MHSDPNYRKINFKNSSLQDPCAHPEINSWLCPDKMTQKGNIQSLSGVRLVFEVDQSWIFFVELLNVVRKFKVWFINSNLVFRYSLFDLW